jgi:hypothetical protein
MDIVRLDTLMRDNLVGLVILMSIFFLYVYVDVIVDTLLEICLFKTHILRRILVHFIKASFIIW